MTFDPKQLKYKDMSKFEDLRVWQDARLLVTEIYSHFSTHKDFGFRDQIQRAAISIINNIAEGAESGSDAMFVRYLKIAKGSCAEVRNMLFLSEDLHYLTADRASELREKTILISSSLQKLIEYLKKTTK